MDKAGIYADLIRRLLLQYDVLETGLKPAAKARSSGKTEEKTASSRASAKEEAAAVAEVSRITGERTFYGLTPGEISDVFERDARRYDGS